MVVHAGGQNICGASIGVLSLDSAFPKPPGHIKNPSGLSFPVLYEILEGLTVPALLGDPSPDKLDPILAAMRRLEAQGVRAITGSCGFLALFQRELAAAARVPVFASSLIQTPLAYQMTGASAPVGVLTASARALTQRHFEGVGAAHVPVVVEGLDDAPEFSAVILRNERTAMDLDKIAEEVLAAGRRLVARAPETRALVLECTDLPPYAHLLQAELRRPIFDLTTLATMAHDVVVRRAYAGFMPYG